MSLSCMTDMCVCCTGTLQARLRLTAWRFLLLGCKHSGAAFIKWAQWSSTRPDVFPSDLCAVLGELHDQAPVHKWPATEAMLIESFGAPVDEVFLSISREPLASGSIAQVRDPCTHAISALKCMYYQCWYVYSRQLWDTYPTAHIQSVR